MKSYVSYVVCCALASLCCGFSYNDGGASVVTPQADGAKAEATAQVVSSGVSYGCTGGCTGNSFTRRQPLSRFWNRASYGSTGSATTVTTTTTTTTTVSGGSTGNQVRALWNGRTPVRNVLGGTINRVKSFGDCRCSGACNCGCK
jgi:hypothetical protein